MTDSGDSNDEWPGQSLSIVEPTGQACLVCFTRRQQLQIKVRILPICRAITDCRDTRIHSLASKYTSQITKFNSAPKLSSSRLSSPAFPSHDPPLSSMQLASGGHQMLKHDVLKVLSDCRLSTYCAQSATALLLATRLAALAACGGLSTCFGADGSDGAPQLGLADSRSTGPWQLPAWS